MLEPKDVQRYERELRAMLLRAGDEDPEGFAAIHQLLNQAVTQLATAAELTRLQHGYSWTDLAHGMGVSRQALHQLVARKVLPIDPDATPETRVTLLRGRIREGVRCTHEQRLTHAQVIDDLADEGTDAAELEATDLAAGVTWEDGMREGQETRTQLRERTDA